MSQNIDPIYSRVGNINGVLFGNVANTKSNGSGTIGTDLYQVFTADGINGSWVSRVRFSPAAGVAATATNATVIRTFISNKSGAGVATSPADTWLFQEVAAPAQTADQTATATNFIEVPLNFALPASGSILVSSHAANAANTSWIATAFGGNY